MRELLRVEGDGSERAFQEAIEFFIRACPGPALAERGLRIVAYQRIRGIVGLDDGSAGKEHRLDLFSGGGGGGTLLRLRRLPDG